MLCDFFIFISYAENYAVVFLVQYGYCARIFGGEPAEQDEFPSLVNIKIKLSYKNKTSAVFF